MIVEVNGHEAHAATGGIALGGDGPVLVLVHGAGMDGTVWQQQTRFLAYRGIRTLAVDLPGHGRSGGEPLGSIVEMADWLASFITAAGFGPDDTVHVAGHSMGTLIGLTLAADRPDLVDGLLLFGTADSMPVHPELIDAAANDLPRAAALMAAWGHDKPAHVGLNPTPGMWMLGGARALVENSTPGALSADFAACVAFAELDELAPRITCPVTVVAGLGDKMTPPKAGARVAASVGAELIELPETGHSMMLENPRIVRSILHQGVTSPSNGESK